LRTKTFQEFLTYSVLLLTLSLPTTAFAQTSPAYTEVQAEATPTGQVMSDKDAIGGSYVTQSSAWQPMIICPLPATGDSWVIWARVRDVSMQLKAVASDGTQTALNWEWQQPEDWTWVSFGRHTRTELGAQVLLMRGSTAGTSPGLDAIVFANDDSFNPDARIPVPQVPQPPLSISINWASRVATATPLSYGLNAFGGFDPSITHSPLYQANMTKMDAGILRLHNWGVLNDSVTDANGWIDTKNQGWDADKIQRDLAGAYGYGPQLLINIPAWPTWMDKNGMLDPTQVDAFAKFCADLVQIVNVQLKLHVKYWEVTNERDGPYYGDFHDNGGALKDPTKPDHVDDLVAIYNRAATAMKAVDPTIEVGGPAVARPDWDDFITRFATGAATNLDFFSFHAYASGSADDSDQHVFDRAVSFGGDVTSIKTILASVSPTRSIPVFFDEYNISWSWETRDPRMTDAKGAIFDALAIKSTVESGVASTEAWNEKDGIYGKMDDSYTLRPSSTLFGILNQHMLGTVVLTNSSDPNSVVAFAVKRQNGNRAVLFINRTKYARIVNISGLGVGGKVLGQISDTPPLTAVLNGNVLNLPAFTIAFVGESPGG